MNVSSTSWIILIETIALCIVSILYFKCCNSPVTVDHRIEDSLRRVAHDKDSAYAHYQDSTGKLVDSMGGRAGYWMDQYNKDHGWAMNLKDHVGDLNEEIIRLKATGNIDSLNKAIDELQEAYATAVTMLNDMANATDSVIANKDNQLKLAKAQLTRAGVEIQDLKKQRDAALADDSVKDKKIEKLTKQKKANGLWAKIATVGAVLASIIAIAK